jgi:hypothetical protein
MCSARRAVVESGGFPIPVWLSASHNQGSFAPS